jgi:hypothetical protein
MMKHRLWLFVIIALFAAVHTVTDGEFVQAANQDSSSQLNIDFSFTEIDAQLQSVISNAVRQDRVLLPSSHTDFVITSVRHEGDWYDITIVPAYFVESGWKNVNLDEVRFAIVYKQNSSGDFFAYLEGSSSFNTISRFIPRDFLAVRSTDNSQEFASGHLFPWTGGQTWLKTQGWHWDVTFGATNAIDFAPSSGASHAVLSSQAGTVRQICGSDPHQRMLLIDHRNHGGGSTGYLHIDASSIPGGVIGQNVPRGTRIGNAYSGNVIVPVSYTCPLPNNRLKYRTPCGCGSGTHLHYVVPTRDMTLDNIPANTVANSPNGTAYRSSNGQLQGAPAESNLVQNGRFDQGEDYWQFDNADRAIYSGDYGNFLAFKRASSSENRGAVYQDLPYRVPAEKTLETTLWIGNSSGVDREVRVRLRHRANYTGDIYCTFIIPARTPIEQYVMRGENPAVWEGMRLELLDRGPAQTPDVLIDSVNVRWYPTLGIDRKQCLPPADPSVLSWDFGDHPDRPHFWTIGRDLERPRLDDSGVIYDIIGDNPYIVSGTVDFRAEDYRYAVIEMTSRADECAELFWRPTGQTRFNNDWKISFGVIADNESRTYVLDMQQDNDWTGTIDMFRLDPACDLAQDNAVRIESISFTNEQVMPSQIVRLSPEGPIESPQVSFSWLREPVTEWYHLYVYHVDSGTEYSAWYPNAVNIGMPYDIPTPCSFGECIVSYNMHSWTLLEGTYRWYVSGWNPNGMGAWQSAPMEFIISADAPNAPSGIEVNPRRGRPEVQWNDDANALWYGLVISGEGQSHENWYAASDVCTNQTNCRYWPEVDLLPGDYEVWMTAWGPGGLSDWVQGPSIAIPDTPTSPPSNLTVPNPGADNPTFRWTASNYGLWYHIVLAPADYSWTYDLGWKPADPLGCAGGSDTCEYTDPDLEGVLPPGDYHFYVRAWGPGGLSTGGVEDSGYVRGEFTYSN